MSHVTGTVQPVNPVVTLGPDSGSPPTSPNTWALNFPHVVAPDGTKLLILHFRNVSLPANNRVEVDLGYGTDVFKAADGPTFWTRPINVAAFPGGLVPVRYITNGAATGGVQIDKYGRGERHPGEAGHPSISNCDPFLPGGSFTEPTYDPFWFCHTPPSWENLRCVPSGDIRRTVARSVGMVVSAHADHISTCSLTLVGPDLVITAGHCVEDLVEEVAAGSVTFDYETECGGARPAGYNPIFHKVKKLVQHRNIHIGGTYFDYCLLQIVIPAGGLGIPVITMRHGLPPVGEQIFGVHHPNGAVKKVSIPHPGFATVLASDAGRVHCDLDVSGGSSGSGLFDLAGRIVGVLSNGTACSLDYFPTATILQDIATPATPPVARDVMIVFDRSGSMSMSAGTGRTKIQEARDAASLFVQLVRAGAGNRVGLVSFSTTASAPVDFALAGATAANKTALIGPAPFSGGVVGGLAPGGDTTIGGGLDAARLQFPAPGVNPRTILLLTDGLQNTPPMIAAVDGSLAGIDVDAIGFGTESSLDGALLSHLAQSHNGLYTRAGSGLELKKFFALAFGNIFEAGALMDPEFFLPRSERTAKPIPFRVCGEEAVTVVLGWDRDDTTLLMELKTPGGASVPLGSPGTDSSTGRTWQFLRVPLPHGGERDGLWQILVFRPGGGEFPPPAVDVRFFVNVLAQGGPTLRRAPDRRRYYTGDPINPLAVLKYPDGTFPENAQVRVTVRRPKESLGNLLSQARLRSSITLDGDTIPAKQATLQAIEQQSGAPAVGYVEETFDLFDDAAHNDGTFEPDGIFGNPLSNLLKTEGNYTFHFQATFGEGCTATREAFWALHVPAAVDPGRTRVTTTPGSTLPGGRREVTITLEPRDPYGNLIGPGNLDTLTVTGGAGTTVTGPLRDNGDGTYTVPGVWDPGAGPEPGVVIGQPDRPPVTVHEPKTPVAPGTGGDGAGGGDGCRKWKVICWWLLALVLLLLILLIFVWK